VIKVRNLNKSFGTNKVLNNINLDIEEGKTIAILGPSGCGKSTLLNCLTGLDRDFEGEVHIDGIPSNLYFKDNRIAIVLQKYSNFEWMSVEENIKTVFCNTKIGEKVKKEKTHNIIDRVGLKGYEHYYMSELSGGMQQRVAVARALAQDLEIVAFDEPFGALDMETRRSLQALFVHLVKINVKTALFVTHDIEEAIVLSDLVIVLGKAPTAVINRYITEQITLETNRYSKAFLDLKIEIERSM